MITLLLLCISRSILISSIDAISDAAEGRALSFALQPLLWSSVANAGLLMIPWDQRGYVSQAALQTEITHHIVDNDYSNQWIKFHTMFLHL